MADPTAYAFSHILYLRETQIHAKGDGLILPTTVKPKAS